MVRRIDKLSPAEIEETIETAARLLVEAAHPEKIILFGSYARGDFTKDSDLDLLVILPGSVNQAEEMVRLRMVLRDIPMPIDVIVYCRDEVERRRHLRGTMLYHALREGRVLHEAA
jgi:predicted nucleotidyltransferase